MTSGMNPDVLPVEFALPLAVILCGVWWVLWRRDVVARRKRDRTG